jgi:hypothetical protein
MNAYLQLAKTLKWTGIPFEWICSDYNNYLVTKLNNYRREANQIAEELNLLCNEMTEIEIRSFVNFPYVAEFLHPKFFFKSSEELWKIQVYAFSFLVWLGKIPQTLNLLNFPLDGLRIPSKSIPVSERSKYSLPVTAYHEIRIPGMDRGGNNISLLSKDIINSELLRIRDAEAFIKKINPNIWNFVASGTELLVLRQEDSESNRFSSASFRGLAGLNVLINPNKVSFDYLVDAIIHESIHSILYQLEPTYGNFFANKDTAGLEIKSPWTNNIITLDNLAQACFVWFGLFNFWQIVANNIQNILLHASAHQIISKVKNGFKFLNLELFENNLNSDMLRAIEYIKYDINYR